MNPNQRRFLAVFKEKNGQELGNECTYAPTFLMILGNIPVKKTQI